MCTIFHPADKVPDVRTSGPTLKLRERETHLNKPPVMTALEIRYGDLDPYGHVNNAVYLGFFETIRLAYWRTLANLAGFTDLEAGDVPGARYVIAETTVRFKASIFLEDTLYGAAGVTRVGNRSYTMDFELRTGESYESGSPVSEGTAAHVFFDPAKNTVQPRPYWFLPTVAKLEDRPETDFTPESF